MTKEELEKEADKYVVTTGNNDCTIDAYIAGAEPREKRIAELEHQLTHRNCLDCSNHSSKLKMRTLELEKENAELREENQRWKDEWQEQVQKATDEGYARTLQTIQLTKAKEIIKAFLDSSDLNIKHKAEEFLGEF